jgi:hypothetical protein
MLTTFILRINKEIGACFRELEMLLDRHFLDSYQQTNILNFMINKFFKNSHQKSLNQKVTK